MRAARAAPVVVGVLGVLSALPGCQQHPAGAPRPPYPPRSCSTLVPDGLSPPRILPPMPPVTPIALDTTPEGG